MRFAHTLLTCSLVGLLALIPSVASADTAQAPAIQSVQSGANTNHLSASSDGVVRETTRESSSAPVHTMLAVRASKSKLKFKNLKTFKTYVSGGSVVVKGSVVNASKKYKVSVQQLVGKKWKVKKKASVKARKSFSLKFQTTGTASKAKFRIVVTEGKRKITKGWTAKRVSTSISVSASANYIANGKSLSLKVATRGLIPGTRLYVQTSKSGQWKDAKALKVARLNQVIDTTVSVPTGSKVPVRVMTRSSAKAGSLSSKSVSVFRSAVCDSATSAPKNKISLWTNHVPGKSNTSLGLADKVTDAICSTKKGASILLSMFIVKPNDQYSSVIFDALEEQAKHNGVDVRFIFEHDRTTAQDRADFNALKSWSKVTVCSYGCNSYSKANVGAINHEKTLLISDTVWNSSVDPLVFVSSGNFNPWELSGYRQVATVAYQDSALYSAGKRDFTNLVECAKGKSACAATGLKASTELSNVYGYPATDVKKSTDSVVFDFAPKAQDSDTQLTVLKNMTCQSGGKIRFWMYSLSSSRLKVIQSQLERLRKEGCSIEFRVNNTGAYKPSVYGIKRAKKLGSVTCYDKIHVKSFSAQNVKYYGVPNTVVWYSGSSNLTSAAVDRSNEANLLVSYSKSSQVSATERTAANNLDSQINSAWSIVGNAKKAPTCG